MAKNMMVGLCFFPLCSQKVFNFGHSGECKLVKFESQSVHIIALYNLNLGP